MESIHFALALSLVPGIGPVRARQIMDHFPSGQAWIDETGPLTPDPLEWARHVQEAARILEKQEQSSIQSLLYTDPRYPQRLLHIPDAPCLLFVKGVAEFNTSHALGVVGTRDATAYGLQITEQWVASLAKYGCAIVSGLARGIDRAAHQSALRGSLPTWAVLAHGLHCAQPASNRHLAEDILAQGGAWVSEWPHGVAPQIGAYPRRNRLIAGMSDGLWVVEAAIKSGAGISAQFAHQYDRSVFALPGRISDVRSHGCLDLIRRQVAQLVTDTSQIAEDLGWSPLLQHEIKEENEVPDDHQKIRRALMQGPLRVAAIEASAGLSSPRCLAALAEMIWLGTLRVQAGYYALA